MAKISLSVELKDGNTLHFSTYTPLKNNAALYRFGRKWKDKQISVIEDESGVELPIVKIYEMELAQ